MAALLLPGLESAGGVRLPLRAGRAQSERAFRRIVSAPGIGRLLLVASLYIVVLQGVLVYSLPAVRAAGCSSFSASATFFAIKVTAMVARLAWGRLADRAAGMRRSRALVQIGLVRLGRRRPVHARAPQRRRRGRSGGDPLRLRRARLGRRRLRQRRRALEPELAGRSLALAATVVFLLSAAATLPLGVLAEHAGWDAFWLTRARHSPSRRGDGGPLAKAWSA